MPSQVDIANMALDSIGARFSITSLTPALPPPNAVVVARYYQLQADNVARAAHWNCLRRQIKLTLIKAAKGTPENPDGTKYPVPPVPWQYEYQYPSDCLAVRYLLPDPPDDTATTPILAGGLMGNPGWWWTSGGSAFAVASDTDASGNLLRVILTDLEYADLVYTGRITDPNQWDNHFLSAVVATLGAWLVNPLARNAEVLKEQTQIASSLLLQARVSDGQEGMTTTDHTPDWLAVRGTTVSGYFAGPRAWYGWESLTFPGGVVI